MIRWDRDFRNGIIGRSKHSDLNCATGLFLLQEGVDGLLQAAAGIDVAKNSFLIDEPFRRHGVDAEAKADVIVPMLAIEILRPGDFVFFAC